ncbi:MAG: DinB family protein [Planctomycetes bacterium]|nr:DinB family protein [Planctomycetota bacterium]
MSADEKARKRVARAEQDVRLTNRAAHTLVSKHSGDPEGWRRARGRSWSVAETLRHLALTASSVLEELRIVAARGALTRPRARSVSQSAKLRFALTTWRFPENLQTLPGTDPGGVTMTPSALEEAHVVWAAGFIALLHEHTPAFLESVRWAHPRYGDMDPVEWARFLRIYFRQHELRLTVR